MPKATGPHGRREAPHPMLLALVAQFLENNGFNSSHRIYNNERRKRPKKEGWLGTFGRNYTAGVPTLEDIFKIWQREHERPTKNKIEQPSDATSSASSSEGLSDHESKTTKPTAQAESSSESESGSDSDSHSSSGSSSGSGSEDHENEMPRLQEQIKPLVTPKNTLKRKASDSSVDSDTSDGSSSSSSSSSSSVPRKNLLSKDYTAVKKARINSPSSESESESESENESDGGHIPEPTTTAASKTYVEQVKTNAVPANDSSSEDGTSDSDESSDEAAEDVDNVVTALDKAASDSSGTVMEDVNQAQVSAEYSSSDGAPGLTEVVLTKKKKHIGAQPTRLAQLSADAKSSDYVSNTYISYDYADKAYRDLSITRGKGFTKEKNKKKRGSYRGGAIDISGGKAFKFDN